MNTLLKITFFSILTLFLSACDTDPVNRNIVDNFDHEAQIPIDQALLDTYFETHYYNPLDEAIWTIGTQGDGALPLEEQLPLSDDPKLKTIEGIQANATETDYTLYYLQTVSGSDIEEKRPSKLDSVFVNYSGMLLDSTVFDSNTKYPVWFSLQTLVSGWGYGLQKFKGGTKAVPADEEYISEEDFVFKNVGKGYLFFPSGLGYRNSSSSSIPANAPLIFELELHQVKMIDTDSDSLSDKEEVAIDASGNITFIDADSDGFSDHLDKDDDDDGKLTIDEVQAGTDPKDPNS
jgi:FKBP-type peptidyl-prolyl cis-trans isomerase FkpA